MSSGPDENPPLLAEPSPVERGLSLASIVRRASGMTIASFVGAAVTTPATVIVGRWLGPVDLGRAQFVSLVYVYASLFRSGVFEGGMRGFIDLRGRGATAEAARAEQLGYSAEMVVSLVPGLALLAAAALVGDPLRLLGFLLAPVAVMASSMCTFLGGRLLAREDFRVVARVNLLTSLLTAGGLVSGVLAVGAAAVFVVPIVVNLIAIVVYAAHRPRLDLRLRFHWRATKPLLRVGFPLGASAVVYWAYRLIGQLSIAFGRSARTLGLFTFAAAPVAVALRLVTSLEAVLMPGLWRRMAADTSAEWLDEGRQLTISTAVLVAALTNIVQSVFPPVVALVAPAFRPAMPIFDVLAFDVLVLSVAAYPTLVLNSAVVNRQARQLMIWVVALAVNAGANALALALGHGVMVVAWNDVWVQAVVVIVVFETALPHIGGKQARWAFYSPILAVSVVAGLVSLGLHGSERRVASAAALGSQLGLRLGAVIAVWGAIALGYRSRLRRAARHAAVDVTPCPLGEAVD
jgi:O-antigen/teichoic acid export membrane protein